MDLELNLKALFQAWGPRRPKELSHCRLSVLLDGASGSILVRLSRKSSKTEPELEVRTEGFYFTANKAVPEEKKVRLFFRVGQRDSPSIFTITMRRLSRQGVMRRCGRRPRKLDIFDRR